MHSQSRLQLMVLEDEADLIRLTMQSLGVMVFVPQVGKNLAGACHGSTAIFSLEQELGRAYSALSRYSVFSKSRNNAVDWTQRNESGKS
jgi:hypothetical protein